MTNCAVLMDDLRHISVVKDTSFAFLLSIQARGWQPWYLQQQEIWLQDGVIWGRLHKVTVQDDAAHWFDIIETVVQPLADLDLLLMRKDPPVDMAYIQTTYLLEQAAQQGLRVINSPASLRDANEKLFTAWFPQCCPQMLVTSDNGLLKEFIQTQQDIVIKPLDGMGGASIFRVREGDSNVNVILETMTQYGRRLVMAQRFIEDISNGDKRILMLHGKPLDYALARIPAADDFRGNIAAGASVVGRPLTEKDRWICEQVGPTLKEKGLLFVGLDVIGDYLTEINVTSPTCVRELDRQFDLNITQDFFDKL